MLEILIEFVTKRLPINIVYVSYFLILSGFILALFLKGDKEDHTTIISESVDPKGHIHRKNITEADKSKRKNWFMRRNWLEAFRYLLVLAATFAGVFLSLDFARQDVERDRRIRAIHLLNITHNYIRAYRTYIDTALPEVSRSYTSVNKLDTNTCEHYMYKLDDNKLTFPILNNQDALIELSQPFVYNTNDLQTTFTRLHNYNMGLTSLYTNKELDSSFNLERNLLEEADSTIMWEYEYLDGQYPQDTIVNKLQEYKKRKRKEFYDSFK